MDIKSGDRVKIESGYGYTWHDNGIQRFRRVQSQLTFTVARIDKLTLFGKTDAGATIEVKYNSAHMWKES